MLRQGANKTQASSVKCYITLIGKWENNFLSGKTRETH